MKTTTDSKNAEIIYFIDYLNCFKTSTLTFSFVNCAKRKKEGRKKGRKKEKKKEQRKEEMN